MTDQYDNGEGKSDQKDPRVMGEKINEDGERYQKSAGVIGKKASDEVGES